MSVKENLIDSRALIDTPEKWGKGDYEPTPGCLCVLGAIALTVGEDPEDPWFHKGSVISEFLSEFLPDEFVDIVDFNDHPDTTHADIMALFDRAIASCED